MTRKVLTQDEALRIASNIARAPNLNARNSSKTPLKRVNQLEALIRDKLPDQVRRHLIDVIIDRTDADGSAAIGLLNQPGATRSVTTIRESSCGRCSRFFGTMTCGPTTRHKHSG